MLKKSYQAKFKIKIKMRMEQNKINKKNKINLKICFQKLIKLKEKQKKLLEIKFFKL